jgi:predicted MFS family arabinose efflux permease
MPDNRWALITFAFAVGMLVWSLGLFAPAVILPYLQSQQGWPVSVISTAITVHFLASALVVAVMPEIHRTLGLRGTIIAGVLAVYLGFIAWATVPSPLLLFVVAPLSGVGLACGSAATVSAIVNAGVASGRAKALGLALNGTAVGGVLLLPCLTFGARYFSLAWTLALLGSAALVILVWMSRSLAGLGAGNSNSPPATANGAPSAAISRRDLFQSARFRSAAAAFSVAIFVQIGIYSQLINHLRPILGLDGATLAMSGCVVLAIVGRFAVAWNIGEANPRIVAAVNFLMQAVGTVALACATGPVMAIAGCILFGLGLGNLPLLPPLIAQKEFHDRNFTLVVASVSAVNQVVLAFGPIFFGLLYDFSGTYAAPFAIGAVLYVVASAIVMIHARPGSNAV